MLTFNKMAIKVTAFFWVITRNPVAKTHDCHHMQCYK